MTDTLASEKERQREATLNRRKPTGFNLFGALARTIHGPVGEWREAQEWGRTPDRRSETGFRPFAGSRTAVRPRFPEAS
jgi:hypothetical protein